MAIIKRNNKCQQGCGEKGCTVDENVNWCSRYKNSMKILQKVEIELPYDPAIPLLGIYPKKMNTNLKRYMHAYIHCNIIYNSLDMKTT